MKAPPTTLDGHLVLTYASVDARTVPTGRALQIIGEEVLRDVKGLAICWVAREGRVVLLRCTDRCQVVTDTSHTTTEEAKRQADYEFEGVEWVHPST